MTRVKQVRNPAAAILLRPFQRFFRLEAASGILLLLTAVIAIVWANSPLSSSYFRLWDATITVDVGLLTISKPLLLNRFGVRRTLPYALLVIVLWQLAERL